MSHRPWRTLATCLATTTLVLTTGPAFADNIHRDTSVGASGPTTITLSGGTASTTIQYYVHEAGGCDIGATPSVWQVNIAGAAGVTPTPATVSFSTCGVNRGVTFEATSAGARAVSLTHVSGPNLGGSNAANPAKFTLTVNAAANTAPVVTVTGVAHGAVYEHGAVPTAGCQVVDAEDGNSTPAPVITGTLDASGLGTQTATCSYTDAGSLTRSASATYSIVDTTDPVLVVPGDQTIEATSPAGASYEWTATATDAVDSSPTVDCNPDSPQTFGLGAHLIECTATDDSGNSDTESFTVRVVDTTDPTLTMGSDLVREATGPDGAAVSYDLPGASDNHDTTLTPLCEPPSGSVFPLGENTVSCTVSDDSGNEASGAFTITVEDTTVPVLDLPADFTAEMTSPAGAAPSYTATASDSVDTDVPVNCTPVSGTTLGIGANVVNCSAADDSGNTAYGSFTITVQDTTPPVLAAHDDVTAEATGPSGAVVNYTKPAATDVASETVTVDCIPDTGATFGLGTTTVNCTATDAHGLTSSSSFLVTIVDTTAPALNLPGDITEEATGPTGAAVSWTASASDLVDGSTSVTCDRTSGSTFALGTATVTCSSTDAAGNDAQGTFNVTVQDTTAPALTLPGDIVRNATSAAGATVNYTASATDLVDEAVFVSCLPASGSTFAPGATTVTCTATDDAGNEAVGTFQVTVSFGFSGFFAPVDNGVVNLIRGGQSVPIKWAIPDGSGGWIGNLAVVSSVRHTTVRCSPTDPVDEVEVVNTSPTSLRYDTTANQYIYNWQSPKGAGVCYAVTVRLTDGATKTATFKTK